MNILGRSPLAQQKRKCGSRYLLRILVTPTLLVLVVTTFYGVENWRGDRLWRHYRQEMEAQGISVELPVTFRESRKIRRALPVSYEAELFKACGRIELAKSLIREAESRRPGSDSVDLVAWKQAFDLLKSRSTNSYGLVEEVRSGKVTITLGNTNAGARAEAAVVVLEAFAAENTVLEKLRSACRRPELLYPLGYDGAWQAWGPIPRAAEAVSLCQRLRVRTSAELAIGESAQALRDLDLMFCLSDSLRREPLLIAGIISVACRTLALASARQALAERPFTDQQLQQLEQKVGSEDLLGDIPRVFRYNCAQFLWVLDEWGKKRDREPIMSGRGEGSLRNRMATRLLNLAIRRMPAGWVQLEKLNFSKLANAPLAVGLSDSPKRINPIQLQLACDQAQKQTVEQGNFKAFFAHTMCAADCLPTVTDWAMRSTAAQVMTDQTRLACALERYYLKQNRYPEKLEQLVPEFLAKLPTDPLSGEPYRYMRDENARYKIWSVGWNEKDDGGLSGGSRYDRAADWVWQYPAS